MLIEFDVEASFFKKYITALQNFKNCTCFLFKDNSIFYSHYKKNYKQPECLYKFKNVEVKNL